MIAGIGFAEILVVFVLILVFFGSKELPQFIAQAAKWWAKARSYSEHFRNELSEVTAQLNPAAALPAATRDTNRTRKQQLRQTYGAAVKQLTQSDMSVQSQAITLRCLEHKALERATAVMVYAGMADEVSTTELIAQLLKKGKRVVIPYCKPSSHDLGLAEISSLENDTMLGVYGIREPREQLRDNFLKSDLGAVLCPGVAFDCFGARLGRGKGYYDTFLRELRGRVPLIGLAFDCQVSSDPFPFDYHDIPIDQVITATRTLDAQSRPG